MSGVTTDAVVDRAAGRPVSRTRALLVAATAGAATSVVVYKVLRHAKAP